MFPFFDLPLFQCWHTTSKIRTKVGYVFCDLFIIYDLFYYYIICLVDRLKHNPYLFLLNSRSTWLLFHLLRSSHSGLFTPAKVQLIAPLALDR